jgi:uncharacterized cupin superfamily protein
MQKAKGNPMDSTTLSEPAPAAPVATAMIAWEVWRQGERFGSRFKHLSRAAVGENYAIGVAIEELQPGQQSCPFHYHMLEEEHVLMLVGKCTLRLGDARHRLAGGDYVCFPAGQKAGHCLINESDAPCRYVLVGGNSRNEVCVYPDSNKVNVRWLGERYDRAAQREYWDGEQ